MAVSVTRRSATAPRVEAQTVPARTDARPLFRRFLARPVIGVFLVAPLLAAVLGVGTTSLLLTLSGAAALYLAVDLFVARIWRPVPTELAAYANLIVWTAGLAVLGAAGWTSPAWQYHGEVVALVGMATGFAVGLGSPRRVAILWTVAASAAVALGASLVGPLTAEPAMAISAIAIGTWFGAVVGLIMERLLPARPPARLTFDPPA